MHTHFTFKSPSCQKGLALVILIVVIALAYISYFVSGLSITEVNVQRERDTLKALKKAKQALIAYAVNYPSVNAARGPGYLPCADQDNDGVGTAIGCLTAGIVNVGRFPWQTLGVGDLRDGANERLWYAVANNFDYTNNPSFNKINTATTGSITVRDNNNNILYDGTIFDAAVAIIIAPGSVLTRDDAVVQDRSTATGDPNASINYLDIDTASGEDNASFQHNSLDGFIEGEIVNGVGNIIVNDQFVVITYGEIMEQIHKRVAGEIGNVINDYFYACSAYPEAALFAPDTGSYDSAAGLKVGLLPVNIALPVDWAQTAVECSGRFHPDTGLPINLPVAFPAWIVSESWHREIYYEFAFTNPAAPLPAPPQADPPALSYCTQGVDCITVIGMPPPNDEEEVILVFAGRDLTANRPSDVIDDYFEAENRSINSLYDMTVPEDYVMVISP